MSTDFYNYLTNVLQKQKSTVFWHTVYIKLLHGIICTATEYITHIKLTATFRDWF